MSDRLTQLQICLDQLIQQFNATINYVNTNSEPSLLDEDDPNSYSNIAANAPVPQAQQQQQQHQQQQQQQQQSQQQSPTGQAQQSQGQSNSGGSKNTTPIQEEANFDNTVNELSTDLILKSRQINMLIDSLPGIGVSPEDQLSMIYELSGDLKNIEEERIAKIKEKDALLKVLEKLIADVATGISETRM
ncbi:Mediator of RNA polymerase II transcription subunit 21 [Candida tropicalis]